MFKYLFRFLFLLLPFPIFAGPHTPWLRNSGGNGNDEILDIAPAGNDALIAVGYFSTVCDFGGTTLSVHGLDDIFVAKVDTGGNYKWVQQFGGVGEERATAVAVGAGGDCWVAGNFSSTCTIGGFTLVPAGNQDVFVAHLNPSGTVLQAFRLGGTGNEAVNSIAVSASGDIALTGSFSGSTLLGTFSFNSQVNPQTAAPSADIFLLKISGTGSVQWAKQGSAPQDDVGTKVLFTPAGDVATIGQFSDTLTFGTQQPNAIYNAAYLASFSSTGTLQWFRRIGGSLHNNLNGLALNTNGQLVIAGILGTGTVLFGPVNTVIGSQYAYNAFYARYTTTGDLLQYKTMGSDNRMDGGLVAIDGGNRVQLAGTFRCSITELQQQYGAGRFISSGQDDIWTMTFSANDTLVRAQQLGGKGSGRVYRLVAGSDATLYMAGSFNQNLVCPASPLFPSFDNQSTNLCPANQSSACNDAYYGGYLQGFSNGGYDFYFGVPIDTTRTPYDFFNRSGICTTGIVGGCIGLTGGDCDVHQDSVESCSNAALFAATNTMSGSAGAFACSIGPDFTFRWSTGATSAQISPTSNGTYTVTMTSSDGCVVSQDQVYVTVHQAPAAPVLSDSKGINTNTSLPQKIRFCVPDSFFVTAGNLNGNDFRWVYDSTVVLDTTFQLVFHQADSFGLSLFVTDTFGCRSGISMVVVADSALSPIHPELHFDKDTISLCAGDDFQTWVYDPQVDSTGLVNCNLANMEFEWTVDPADPFVPTCLSEQGIRVYPATTGYYRFEVKIVRHSDCGPSDSLFVSDSVYVRIFPRPNVSPSIQNVTGKDSMCIGDTARLTTGGGYYFSWTGPGILTNSFDSSIVVNMPGAYCVVVTDSSVQGCVGRSTTCISIAAPDPVTIHMTPSAGVICPGDSVLLQADPGTAYQWFGPTGLLPDTTQAIYVRAAGTYFCSVMHRLGCPLLTNSVTVEMYGAPTLVAMPVPAICNNRPIELHVLADHSSVINWNAPIVGHDSIIVVTQPGVYSCTVNACGIQSNLSVTITTAQVNVQLQANGPLLFCEGDSVLLSATPGFSEYQWVPNVSDSAKAYAGAAGTYAVVVVSQDGCVDTSNTITVSTLPTPPPFAVSAEDSLCEGAVLHLDATGVSGSGFGWSGPGGWTSSDMHAVIDPVTAANSGVYQAQVSNGTCERKERVSVLVTGKPELDLSVPNPFCAGPPIDLHPFPVIVQHVLWTGPLNYLSTWDRFYYEATLPIQSGTYQLSFDLNGCTFRDSLVLNIIDCEPDFPNVFTPNSDGYNDVFGSSNSSLEIDRIDIYNRWGNLVYSKGGKSWNGRDNNGHDLPPSTYYYIIYFKPSMNLLPAKGFVELMR